MTKQQEIIAYVNMLSGYLTLNDLIDKYGNKPVMALLKRGLIKLDDEMVFISEHSFQNSVNFR